ncbi:snapalysin family zinc-dependent metalloprotease [Micromonospora sp. WMMD882]|uniref:snapalysin family zinc-dependent metalloprotease n=1 Tax=Micromonospora sp. WMMD882 TaxID=3015151 RepID=UPI00248B3632|nr:snapalysin family zinc-dependent metalloprotease [Micromonospora sp. WMMD882]WBB79684.1 snapalysin family zinc-dependent metalloprotease [Micromonospora sp. WMMD882]
MSPRRIGRRLTTLLAGAATALGLGLLSQPAPAAADVTVAATVCYNTSQAGPYAGTADQAASIWTSYTRNVTMSKCGSNLMIYYTTGGGSYAVRRSLGNGYVVIDTVQASQYSPLRIMTHEIGHILGLPDNYNGQCYLLMSGGSAGTGCTNPYPYSTESAQVDRNFGGLATTGAQVFRNSWPTPATVG